jgi:hypothetical protein
MLAFTSVYFSGISLFNRLRPFGVKKCFPVSSSPCKCLRRSPIHPPCPARPSMVPVIRPTEESITPSSVFAKELSTLIAIAVGDVRNRNPGEGALRRRHGRAWPGHPRVRRVECPRVSAGTESFLAVSLRCRRKEMSDSSLARMTWMAGTSPAMTTEAQRRSPLFRRRC